MSYFDRTLDRYVQTLEAVRPTLSRYRQPKIYDIGGYGHFCSMIKKEFESSEVSDFCSADLNTIPLGLPSNSADVLFLCEVIEHLYNPDLVVLECRRVLRKGGSLIITTPNLASWFNRILQFFGYFPLNLDISCASRYSGKRDILQKSPVDKAVEFNPLFDVHVRLYTISILSILLEQNNFRVVSTHGYWLSKSANFKVGNALDLVNKGFSKIPSLSHGFIITAEAV